MLLHYRPSSHLAKEQVQKPMAKVFTGEELNILAGSRPYDNSGESDLVKLNIMSILNKEYGITEEDFLSAELSFVPALKTRDVGVDERMIGGYGHDDRVCAYPALTAIREPEMT